MVRDMKLFCYFFRSAAASVRGIPRSKERNPKVRLLYKSRAEKCKAFELYSSENNLAGWLQFSHDDVRIYIDLPQYTKHKNKEQIGTHWNRSVRRSSCCIKCKFSSITYGRMARLYCFRFWIIHESAEKIKSSSTTRVVSFSFSTWLWCQSSILFCQKKKQRKNWKEIRFYHYYAICVMLCKNSGHQRDDGNSQLCFGFRLLDAWHRSIKTHFFF